MAAEDVRESRTQRFGIKRAAQAHIVGHVVGDRGILGLRQDPQPLLAVRQRVIPCRIRGQDYVRAPVSVRVVACLDGAICHKPGRKTGHGRVLEQGAHFETAVEVAVDLRDQAGAEQGIPVQGKEIVMRSDLLEPESRAPERRHCCLRSAIRMLVDAAGVLAGFRQRRLMPACLTVREIGGGDGDLTGKTSVEQKFEGCPALFRRDGLTAQAAFEGGFTGGCRLEIPAVPIHADPCGFARPLPFPGRGVEHAVGACIGSETEPAEHCRQ